MTKAELLVIAEELGLIISSGATKAQIITAILADQTIENVPSQSGTITYDGTAKTPTWSNFEENQLTISGDTTGTNAGNYTVTFTPTDGHQWEDETTTGKTATWTISKAEGSLTLSANTASLDSETTTATVTVTNPTGEVSVESSDETAATAEISEGTITITRVGAGSTTVTVTAAASANYNEATDTITVTVE